MVSPGHARRRPPAESAFTLVGLLITVTVINVVVAAALPLWSQTIKREKEEELIFRGLQYAEAIRIFQERNGRLPISLEELIENEPRCIRQLWKDPMNPDGQWGLIFSQGVPGGVGDDPDGEGDDAQGRDLSGGNVQQGARSGLTPQFRSGRGRGGGEVVTTGPIMGVHSLSDEKATKFFIGGESYDQWQFTVDLIPVAPAVTGEHVPSLNSRWVGRPFPEGVEPQEGSGLGDEFDDEDDDTGDNPLDRQRERRRKRRDRDDG